MPFHRFTWRRDGTWDFDIDLGPAEPPVELRQKGAESFVLLRSFCYLVPDFDTDEGTVYVVPGVDGPVDEKGEPIPWSDTKKAKWNGHDVVIPPNPKPGETDLASVPWYMWWLIATYGNHTRATLMHDALVVDEGTPPIARTAADRLLLTALREPGQRTGAFRHWLMWAAVGAFGTMGKLRGALVSAHVLALWALLVSAVVAAWGTRIWSWWPDGVDFPGPDSLWHVLALVIATFGVLASLLWILGGAWRLGVDNRAGWLAPMAAVAAIILLLIGLEWPWELALELSPLNLLLASLVLLVAGVAWGRAVDHSVWGWFWPTAYIGLPIALLPVALIFASVYLVAFIDKGAARVRSLQRDEPYVEPEVKPTRLPI